MSVRSFKMSRRNTPYVLMLLTGLLTLAVGSFVWAETPQGEQVAEPSESAEKLPEVSHSLSGVLQLDQTVISGNQELPKVLYILPWRDPSGLPEIDLNAQHAEMDVFRPLYPPAYRRELKYFESLEAAGAASLKSSED